MVCLAKGLGKEDEAVTEANAEVTHHPEQSRDMPKPTALSRSNLENVRTSTDAAAPRVTIPLSERNRVRLSAGIRYEILDREMPTRAVGVDGLLPTLCSMLTTSSRNIIGRRV